MMKQSRYSIGSIKCYIVGNIFESIISKELIRQNTTTTLFAPPSETMHNVPHYRAEQSSFESSFMLVRDNCYPENNIYSANKSSQVFYLLRNGKKSDRIFLTWSKYFFIIVWRPAWIALSLTCSMNPTKKHSVASYDSHS